MFSGKKSSLFVKLDNTRNWFSSIKILIILGLGLLLAPSLYFYFSSDLGISYDYPVVLYSANKDKSPVENLETVTVVEQKPKVLSALTENTPATSIFDIDFLRTQIKEILNDYINQSKFVSLSDLQGIQGVNSVGMVANQDGRTTAIIGGAPIVTYLPASNETSSGGSTIAAFTSLSSSEFLSSVVSVDTTLTVSGTANFSGQLSVATATITRLDATNINFTGNLYQNGVAFSGGSSQWQNGTSSAVYYLSGNVGIGTSTPSEALSVQGNLRLTGAIFDSSNASGTPGMILQTTGTSTQWVATSSLGLSGGTATLATGTVTRLNFKNLNTPPYKYNSSVVSSTTLSGVTNIQTSFFDGNYVWFGTDSSPAKLVRVEPTTNQNTTFTMNSGEDSVFAMTTDGTYLYASTLTFPSKILKIDPHTGNRVETYTLTSPANRIINMIYDGRYIWGVAYDTPAAVIKFDPTDGTFVSYPMSSGDNSAWGLVSDGENLWISTDTSPAKIFKFNMSSGTYTSITLSSPTVQYVDGGVFDGTNVWFSSGDSPAKLLKVNTQTNQIQIFNMNPGEHYGASLTFDGQNLWMSIKNGSFGRLLKIDPKSPYSHTTYNLDPVNIGMTNVTFDGANIWAGTYSNPAVIYRIPNAGGNPSYTSAGYFDFVPTTTSPALLIQPSGTSNWNNASSTYLGVNATSTFAGNLLDLQANGITQFRITSQGMVGVNTSSPAALLSVRGTGTTTPFIVTSSTGATILVANTNQRVGVGTSSPIATLSVQGASAFGSVNPFVVASSSGAQMFSVTNTGKVAIGSAIPGTVGLASAALEITDTTGLNSDFQLRVSGNNQASIAFLSTGGTLATPSTSTANTILGILEFDGYDGGTHRRGASITSRVEATPTSGVFSGNLIFNTNSSSTAVTERMRITSIGNVGIGTSNPVTTLTVIGTTTSVSMNVTNATSSYQIKGVTVLSNTSGSNLFVGPGAGSSNSTGTSNTFLGKDAAFLNTSGYGNTILGKDAGYANTSGSQNTFVGLSAGNFNGAGSDNVYIGYYSAVSTFGSYNVHIGSSIDRGGQSFSSTIAIGYDAQPTASNQLIIGSNSASGTITSAYLGQGVTKVSPGGVTLYATGGSGTNNAGANFGISGGRGTGNSTGGSILFITSDPIASGSTAQPTTTKAVITASGRFGIGTTSPIATLTVVGTTSAPTLNSFVVASTSGAQLFTVQANGNVGIGTSSPSAALEVRGNGTGATIAKFTDNNSTGCTLATGGTISCSSDARLKKNVEDLSYGLEAVMNLHPVEYNWSYEDDTVVKNLGFIAQEVQQVIPKLVNQDVTGQYQLNTTGVVPVLTKAVQEQQDQINTLQNTINNLQNSGNDLSSTSTVINVQLYLSEDNVGQAKILAGQNSVRVTFKYPYKYQPIVTITSLSEFIPGFVKDVDATGFTIEIDSQDTKHLTKESLFNWHSFAGKEAKLTVSDGSTYGIDFVLPVVPTVPDPEPVVDNSSVDSTSNEEPTEILDPESGPEEEVVESPEASPEVVAPQEQPPTEDPIPIQE